jgi:hypothetical protein
MQPDLVRHIISNSNITECNFCTFGSISNAAIMFQKWSRHVIRGFLRSLEANTGIIPEIRPHNCFRTRPFHFVIYLSQQSPFIIPTVVTVTKWRYRPKNPQLTSKELPLIVPRVVRYPNIRHLSSQQWSCNRPNSRELSFQQSPLNHSKNGHIK